MPLLSQLLEKNARWAEEKVRHDPEFFERLSNLQAPDYLWIGCSDSRVPANQIVDLAPGELFVHRNVANLVVHSDLNCLSVIQFAVEVLQVNHIIVCGHYGCGGIAAALLNKELGLIENWLRHIQDVKSRHDTALDQFDLDERCDRLCELNVLEGVSNVSRTTIVRNAWRRGQNLTVHGWIYSLSDGRLKDLGMSVQEFHATEAALAQATARVLKLPGV